ncbi:MAG: hypothetical protein PHW78_02300 [Macromonas bipunctata]|nr:hypothetical protein [Macromonas bipunctata]
MQQDNDKPNDQQATHAQDEPQGDGLPDAVTAWLAAPREVLTGQAQAEHEAAWFDATLDAAGFFAMERITPVQAAMLLCRFSPHDETLRDAETSTTDETTPDDFKRLMVTFEDRAAARQGARSLPDWMAVAAGAGRKTHSWAVRYAKHYGLYGPPAPHREAEPLPSVGPAATAPQSVTINVHIQVQPEQPPAQEPPPPAPEESPAPAAPAWPITKPQRYKGYSAPLHRLLAAAHRDGKPRPTAREVVEAWHTDKPAEIAKMLTDGFDYYDAKGNTKPADLDAIRKAIERMTSTR